MEFDDGVMKGTCEKMCPVEEIRMREKERLLHPLEILEGTEKCRPPKADPKKTVKKFSRCAAGQQMPKPSSLRTSAALMKTITYLLTEVITLENCDLCTVYDFLFDRLCAVRQDVVIQDLDIEHSIEIMKPIVRFLAYSGYRMCEEPTQRYDPAINFRHFTECLRKLLKLYDASVRSIIKHKHQCNCERSQFEALYLITFLGSTDAISRGLMLQKEMRTPLVNLALQISIAYYGRNYVRVCRIIKDLPALLLCAAALHLPSIRRNALFVMNVAFSGRNLQYPASSLVSDLLYENEDSVIEECVHYGIKVQDKNILFLKGLFKEHESLKSLQHHKFIDTILESSSLPHLLNEYTHQCWKFN